MTTEAKDLTEEPPVVEDEDEAEDKPEEKELLCTICGLRACWQKT